MTDQIPDPKPGMSRGMRIVLGLSLALNLLVIGAVAGAFLRGGGPARMMDDRAAIGRVLYRELPREDRRALRQELRRSVDRATLRDARVGPALDAALRAEPFDVEAVRDLMTRQAAALQTGQRVMRDGWLEILDGMSPQARAAYADRLRDAMRAKKPIREGG